jgi:hypothetical protein
MKQLHFQRAGSDIQVAYEGNYRFVIHTVREQPELYLAQVFDREGGNTKPLDTHVADTRAKAIDWLARKRETSG